MPYAIRLPTLAPRRGPRSCGSSAGGPGALDVTLKMQIAMATDDPEVEALAPQRGGRNVRVLLAAQAPAAFQLDRRSLRAVAPA